MLQRFNVLGVGVCAINMNMALETIERWISEKKSNYITVTGVHGVMESQFDEDLRRIHNEAGMVTPDGMPMVWLGRRRGFEFMDRVYGPDLMLAVCDTSQGTGYRHFFYGGDEGVPMIEFVSREILLLWYIRMNALATSRSLERRKAYS
jgi:N-acetylglucosaminyldiphosphoundecaprenol N-acetyl-beta-D-mannosaminyltransferase